MLSMHFLEICVMKRGVLSMVKTATVPPRYPYNGKCYQGK